MERALFNLQQKLEPDLFHALATSPDNPASDRFYRERLSRFESRGCSQLDPVKWEAETGEIAKIVTAYLERRYRDFLT